ncbi:MAG: GDP-mannose 4,6-dehydratase [Planctomycetota bacterium]|nr:GDP-mannose 4,6-dehydratase [Planctomycetota bacterium]
MAGNYLVTGAAGFIGSNVVAQLLAAGHQVTGIDNINDAYDTRLKRWRLDLLSVDPRFQFHEADIVSTPQLELIFAESKPFDAVINLAARAGVRPSVENPWIYFQANTDGTLNLLDLCRRNNVPKFVLSSTSSLYGGHNTIPFSEDADTNRPLSPYAASKKGAEAISYTYHHLHNLDITVLRYFTVYGPCGRPDMSIFRFVRKIAEGEPIIVFGDGTQQRDFTYVEDIARGTIAALQPVGYEAINLGGDQPIVLNDIIARISRLVDREAKIIHKPAHPADVPATWASIEKAKRLLGWGPKIDIDEGLRRCVEWYRANRELACSVSLGDG